MLKKIILSLCFVFASASSLFALDKGSFILYPQAGFGISGAYADAASGYELNYTLNLNYGGAWEYKDPEIKSGISLNTGMGIDYMVTGFLAFTSGILLDYISFKVVYKSPSNPDAWMKFDLLYAGIPLGLRLYAGAFMAGCGLYIAAPVLPRASSKYGPDSSKGVLSGSPPTAGFFIDAGLNFNTSDINNLMIFLRMRNDYTYSHTNYFATVRSTKNWSLLLTAAYGFKVK